MSIRTSLSESVGSMISAYSYLKTYVGKKATNIRYIDETLQFLIRLKLKGSLSTENNTDKEIAQFFRIFLDLAGIVSATKGQFEPLSIGDIQLIGKKKAVSGILSSGQTSVDDWICSVLFQGWVRTHEPDLSISTDLRYEISKYGRCCDFEVRGIKIPRTLVECKRLHPFDLDKESENDVLGLIIQKIVDKCSTVKKQFADTETRLGNGRCIRTLIVDISSYGENCLRNVRDGIRIGLDEKAEIETISSQLVKEEINGIHQLVLAWSDVFFFKGVPRALAYYTKPIPIDGTNLANPQLNYEGWTVEFYPLGKDLSKYVELRLSNTARSFEWIYLSWLSVTDNLITWGPQEITSHNKSGDNSIR